jgi:hypothetical protein
MLQTDVEMETGAKDARSRYRACDRGSYSTRREKRNKEADGGNGSASGVLCLRLPVWSPMLS